MSTKRFEIYAPVIITTLCRYEHFKRCIDSLSRCTGAEFTDVYIGIDYPKKEDHWDGYNKICEYVNRLTGFNHLTVLKREYNYGASDNMRELIVLIKKKYDRFIFSEDDNEFSPNFLDYMNEGLEKYKDDPNVLKICGCLMPWDTDVESILKTYPYNIFPAKDYNASGVGVWVSKTFKLPYMKDAVLNSYYLTAKAFRYGYWQAITRYLYQLRKDSQLHDVSLRLYCAFNDKYCIFPRISKVKNWGYDGSGLYSDNNPRWLEVVTLDTSPTFRYDNIEIKNYKEVKTFVGRLYGVPGIKNKMIVIAVYLYYRITGRRIEDVPKGQRLKYALFGRFVSKSKD